MTRRELIIYRMWFKSLSIALLIPALVLGLKGLHAIVFASNGSLIFQGFIYFFLALFCFTPFFILVSHEKDSS